jgi:glycosyltransferase involved in cell wall biosynthesis
VRVFIGIRNCFTWGDTLYVLDPIMPETLIPALMAKLLGRTIIIDISDEWLDSPTYKSGSPLLRFYIRTVENLLVKTFPVVVVPCEYLYKKFVRYSKKLIKMTNGVNPEEFVLVPRAIARERLGFNQDDKILLAIGNTFEGKRKELLWKVYKYVKELDPKVILIAGKYLSNEELPYYLGACDLALFPTSGEKNELACCSIRVMTYLNAERVIATDDSDSEWHNLLKDCLLMGEDCEDLAEKILLFFRDPELRKRLEENVKLKKKELSWDNLIDNLART